MQEEDSNKFLKLCPKTLFPPSLKKSLESKMKIALGLIKPFTFLHKISKEEKSLLYRTLLGLKM